MNNTTNSILDIFQGFRMNPLPIDQYDQIGKQVLAGRLQPFLDNNKPIEFVMMGFPMKSPNNRDKVIGVLPDLGEEVAFKNFENFNNLVKQVYTPGVNVSIVNDGFVFSDIMEVPDKTVDEYKELSMEMSKNASISWFDIRDFYSSGTSIDEMRKKVVGQFGITPEELERRILMDPDVNSLYRGMIKFMTGDLAIRNFSSNSQLQKQAKILAREMMFRNEAYSKLVAHEFGYKIRLSMHPSVNNGTKYSFQLIPSPKAWTSPWHCALAIGKDGQYETVHRKDAELKGYELMFNNGRPYNYVEV